MDSVPQSDDERNYAPTPEVKKAADRLGVLMASERDAIVACRFEIGDIFNRMEFHSGSRAVQLMDRYGEGTYKHFRHCAWVAYRWPKKDRIHGKSWDFFKNSDPGDAPRVPAIPTFHISEVRTEYGQCILIGTNGRGKSVKITGTIEEMRRALHQMVETSSE